MTETTQPEATADLTLRGVTQAVRMTGELLGVQRVDFGDAPQRRAGHHARAAINRRDFGLAFNRVAEGVAVVADEVELLFEIQARRVPQGS